MTDDDLARFLAEKGVDARLVRPGQPTPTVPDAARALGVEPRQIVKSLVFLADGAPVLVVAAGEARIHYPSLARALGLSRRRVKLASPEEALERSGFPVGAMPPFGHRRPLATLADASSLNPGGEDPGRVILYAGGGTDAALLEVSLATLLRVSGARLADLTDA